MSVDLIQPLHRTEHGNEYIVVLHDHFTKCTEGDAVPSKEAMALADVIVQEWVYVHVTPLNLHSDMGNGIHRCNASSDVPPPSFS